MAPDKDGDGIPDLEILFDRQAFAGALTAGIAAGEIRQPTPSSPTRISVDLMLDKLFLVGSARFKIKAP